jgi:hypothetical protein
MKYLYPAFLAVALFIARVDASWVEIQSPIGSEKIFIDSESITAKDGISTIRTRNVDRKGEEIFTTYSIDCSRGIAAVREIVIKGTAGREDRSYSFQEGRLQWSTIKPRSFVSGFHEYVCNGTVERPAERRH